MSSGFDKTMRRLPGGGSFSPLADWMALTMRRTVFNLISILVMVGLAGCASQSVPSPAASPAAKPTGSGLTGTVTVFAAASLIDGFNEIGQAFQAAHPHVKVQNNYAGSQQLAQQLILGAEADVFASANRSQLQAVIEAGLVKAGDEQVFARNRLVVIYPVDNPAGLTHLQDLQRPGLRLVLAAKQVPVGQYALDFLEKASQSPEFGEGFAGGVLKNVVSYEENVRAVLTKVALGEADAGIVYASDVGGSGQGYEAGVGRLDIPDELNVVAEYPMAQLQGSPNPEAAEAFIRFVLSPAGQEILVRYGFEK